MPTHINNNSTRKRPNNAGTDTPRDLDSRVKLLELFALHVLPRNDEWDYARAFITHSEVLDDERKEGFLQGLDELMAYKDEEKDKEDELQKQRDEEVKRVQVEEENRRLEQQRKEQKRTEAENAEKGQTSRHRRTNSELDYGIDTAHPAATSPAPRSGNAKPSKRDMASRTQFSPPPEKAHQGKKTAAKPAGMVKKASLIIAALQKIATDAASSLTRNPLALIRMLFFLLAIILAFGRQDVRNRVRRITGAGWNKVRSTVGMGVKVSYI